MNIFSHIREDMQKLRSQVQSLSDTHMMIQQFNSHADNLSQRSKEIEALIVAQNESKMRRCRQSATAPMRDFQLRFVEMVTMTM